MTHLKLHVLIAALSWFVLVAWCLPTSLVEEVKDNEARNFKVKRAHDRLEKSPNVPSTYNKPTAIKRDVNRSEQYQGWTNEGPFSYSPSNILPDDKYLSDYEKAYKHAENQEKLDEALRNAILKSEIYGEPTSMGQYKYYADDQKRRRRRNTQKLNYDRIKREVDLSPEEILTILNMLEKERQKTTPEYNFNDLDFVQTYPTNYVGNEDESWLDGPVYPHISSHKNLGEHTYEKPHIYGKFSQFNDAFDLKPKRFKVAKKMNEGYLNNPSVYHTLARLLNNQREQNLPVYHRTML